MCITCRLLIPQNSNDKTSPIVKPDLSIVHYLWLGSHPLSLSSRRKPGEGQSSKLDSLVSVKKCCEMRIL